MARGGKAVKRRKEQALLRWTHGPGSTGSHRNGGKGFSRIPIAAREQSPAPITHTAAVQRFPRCAGCRWRMRFEQGVGRQFWWVCHRCQTALPYKPLKTGLTQSA